MALFIELDRFGSKASINIDKIRSIVPRKIEEGTDIYFTGELSPIPFSEAYGEVIRQIEQKLYEERYQIALENAMQTRIQANQNY